MRVRITVAVALLVALGLTGAGAIVYAVEAQRIDDQIVSEIDQELAELAALQDDGKNPDTDEAFPSVGDMLDTFLARNVPDDNEVLVTWYDGGPQQANPASSFVSTPLFSETVQGLLDSNGSTHLDIPGYGEALITVQSVRNSQQDGALVVVTYLELGRAELRETMRTYAVVALLSLIIVTGVAAWLSGRLLAPLRSLRETAADISETDLSQRLPETRQRRHLRADPHLQQHARPAGARPSSTNASSSTTPATSSRHRSPCCVATSSCSTPAALRRSPRPASCCSTRSTGCLAWSAT